MGLDACVYCDCVEKNLLKIPHPLPSLLFIDETGYSSIASDNEADQDIHDAWTLKNPCIHQNFQLIHHRLGNISAIALIRDTIEKIYKQPSIKFPVLWAKVIYSGSHCGDFLTHDNICQLQKELSYLSCSDNITDECIKDLYGIKAIIRKFILMPALQFKSKEVLNDNCSTLYDEFLPHLQELVQSSLAINKPIYFR